MSGKAKDIFRRAEKIKSALASAQPQELSTEAPEILPPDKYSEELRIKIQKDSSIEVGKEKLTWDDVAGLEPVKAALNEAVILPKKFPQLFKGKRIPNRGVLMYGPPGTGKTHIARTLASMADMKFFSVSASTLISKYVGEGEKMVKELFKLASENKPSIIFVDEIDSILSRRSDAEHEASRRLKTEFFIRMQEVIESSGDEPSVLVLAATNRPWDLDPAALRRFGKRIYVPEPDAVAREKLLEINLKGEKTMLRRETLHRIAGKTEGYSGADMATIAREALMFPVREALSAKYFFPIDGDPENPESFIYAPCTPDFPGAEKMTIFELPQDSLFIPPVTEDHLEKALDNVKSSVSPEEIDKFVEWGKKYGQEQNIADDDFKYEDKEIEEEKEDDNANDEVNQVNEEKEEDKVGDDANGSDSEEPDNTEKKKKKKIFKIEMC